MNEGDSVLRVITDKTFHLKSSVLALGTFDGVHIAHQVLLKKAAALGRQTGAPSVVYTFANHPLECVDPQRVPPLLTTLEMKQKQMERCGVDVLCMVPFDEAMMRMPPETFVGELVRRFHPRQVVCGYNYTFGFGGAGTAQMLTVLGAALGFGCSVVPKIGLDGQEVSSTQIRTALLEGQDALAAKLLGRPYGFFIRKQGETFVMQNDRQLLPAAGQHRALFTGAKGREPFLLTVLDSGEMLLPKAFSGEKEGYLEVLKKIGETACLK